MSRNRQGGRTGNQILPLYLLAGGAFIFGVWAWATGQQEVNSNEAGAAVLYALPFVVSAASGGLGCAIQRSAPAP